jgi:hypothetical protein
LYVWYCQFCLLSLLFSFFFLSLLYSCCCSFLYSGETRLSNTYTCIPTYIYRLSVSSSRYGFFLACILSSFCMLLFLLVTSHYPFHDRP